MQCATANPDGRPRALIVGGGIANFTDVAATFGGIIRAMREKVREVMTLQVAENMDLSCAVKDLRKRIFSCTAKPNEGE